jgi:hypothetical protein
MAKLTETNLNKKSEDQLKNILDLDYGYVLGSKELGKPDLIKLILQLEQAKQDKENNKFTYLSHLAKYIPMTEEMITDAFYSSSPAFREKYFKGSDVDVETQKEVFYEVRDIVISNNLKAHRPQKKSVSTTSNHQPHLMPTSPPKEIKEAINPSPDVGEAIEKIAKDNPSPVITPEDVGIPSNGEDKIDISTLKKKGDRVNYIIDLFIEEGKDVMKEIKARHIMDKYTELFDDSVSDGYAYDKIVERKKSLKAQEK